MARPTHLLGLPRKHKREDIEDWPISSAQHGTQTSIPAAHHRPWNWADEQGWNRMFALPFEWTKDGSVFLPSGVTGKFDKDWVEHPCVLRVGDYYYLFYDGTELAAGHSHIGVARFTDPTGTYTRLNNGDPIITVDNCHVPSVIYDFYETDGAKKWKMWYTKTPLSSGIQYSYSANPDSGWSPGATIGIAALNMGHSMIKIGKLYCLFVPQATGTGLKLYASTLPNANFLDMGIVLDVGTAGQWDAYEVRYVTATYISGTYYIFYSGRETSAVYLKIGKAMSPYCALADGAEYANKFRKYRINPIIQEATSHVLAPSLLEYEEKFYMWYEAYAVKGIMLGTIP